MERMLRVLCALTGWFCVAVGVMHFVLGVASVPGEGSAGATVDSRERFYAAIFAGYGLAWAWAARQTMLPIQLVRGLAGLMLLGGLGRLLSLPVHGQPQWFQSVLAAVELLLPPLVLALTGPKSRAELPI